MAVATNLPLYRNPQAAVGLRKRAGIAASGSFGKARIEEKAPRLAQRAQLSQLSVRPSGSGQLQSSIEADARAFALGRIDAHGVSGSMGYEAIARAQIQASGHAEIGDLVKASASGKAAAEVGSSAKAGGHLRFGIDSLGLPSIDASAGAEAMAGARASGNARGHLSLLELVEIDVNTSAQAIAGAAAAIAAGFGFKDGKIWVKSGATAAAGAGVSGTADVGVGLGKIPRGVLQTTVSPVLAVPTLAVSTIYKGVASLFGDTPDVPDLTDLPKAVAGAFTEGVKNVADGVAGIGKQLGDVVGGIGKFFGNLF